MDLALNNLQRLICDKNQTTNLTTKSILYIYIKFMILNILLVTF